MGRANRLIWRGAETGHRAGAFVSVALALCVPDALQAQDPAARPGASAAGQPAEYRLLAGDEITVKLPLNPELDTSGPIGPDGRFSIPLAGRVAIGGLTVDQAERAISASLREAKVVADAKPAIVVTKYMGVIYVGGEVRTPGPVALTQAMNPLQAIISAGGLLNTARSRKVAIVRQPGAGSGPPTVETVNVRDIVRGQGGKAPLLLAPGDIVFVPRSTIAEVNLFVSQYVNGLIPDALNFNVNLGNNTNTTTTVQP